MTLLKRLILPSGELFFEARERRGRYYLTWSRAGAAVVSERGRLLDFTPHPTAQPVSITILRRIIAAYAASLRGHESLHATGLQRGGQVIALIGCSGEGKSTLAASLLQSNRSVRLLSDDVLYLFCRRRRGWVLPSDGAPVLKLARASLQRLAYGQSGEYEQRYDANFEKEVVIFPNGPPGRRSLPLAAIVHLQRGHALQLTRLRGTSAALTLMANTYNALIRPPKVVQRQFNLCAAISECVPIWRLRYESGFEALPDVGRQVEQLWQC